ncbi:MAG: NADH-quinone oxidoreductase subunit NuoG, partial [Chloroflexi bacterium]|nr:NADH-quinone oxidoreductase subunit NuoG [Chloroflexota bacterium]
MSDDLVTLTIDGVELSVPKGMLVVDAAKKIGNDIPVFCYHPKLEPVGMCRMCLVEIGLPMRDRVTGELMLEDDGSPKLNFGRGMQTGCTVVVSEGMVVRTQTEPVDEAREDMIEFLLSSHPLDCPVCDKGGECPLQNLTMAYGNGSSRMDFALKLKMDKHVPLGEMITLDRERCIQCARCIRFQEEIVDDPVIRFHNRGRSLEIVTLSEPGFDSYWSGNTTDLCPVGALTSSDFRFGARPWELIPVASISVHSAAGANLAMCTRREAKTGGRSVIKRIMPRQNEQVNEVWIHDRDRFVHHFADAPDRLQKPMVRKNGELAEVSWDEALELVARKLNGLGTEAAGLSGDRLSNEDLFMFQKLLREGVKTPHVDLGNRRLLGGDVTAQVGISSDSNLADLGAGDAIIVVASDLHEEEPIWWLRTKQAAERGAILVTVNVRPTRLDKFAAHTIQYKPGQVVATVRQLVNATKVDTDSTDPDGIAAAADALIKANNIVAFYGAEGLTLPETEALAQLLGNLLLVKAEEAHAGRKNNGLIAVWPHNNTQGAWDMGIHPAYSPGYKALDNPGRDAATIYAGVKSGEVKALYVAGTDPVGDGRLANRGQLEFLVVQELFLTETAQLADVVLPAQSWAERDGTFTSGERRVQRYYPAIQPLGECREDWRIFAQIGEKLGLGKPAFAASLIFRDISKAVPQYKGMDYRSLARVEEQWPIIGRDDLYYGGTSYENKSGLGQQWAAAAESGNVNLFEVGETAVANINGLSLV